MGVMFGKSKGGAVSCLFEENSAREECDTEGLVIK